MAQKIKFFRGAQGVSMTNVPLQDGAIFIVERDSTNSYGDMYVDISSSKRLHIQPDSQIVWYTASELSNIGTNVSKRGTIYLTYELSTTTSNNNYVKKIKKIQVGDGGAFIRDLPSYEFVTTTEKQQWNNKVSAYYQPDSNNNNNEVQDGTLILTTGSINAN